MPRSESFFSCFLRHGSTCCALINGAVVFTASNDGWGYILTLFLWVGWTCVSLEQWAKRFSERR